MTTFAVLLFFSGLAACDSDDSTGPSRAIDAVRAEAAVDSLVGKFLENEAKNSIDGLSGFITAITNLSIASAAAADPVATAVPTFLLGATCVWDLQRANYVDDPERTGAPQNGIRFVLYTLDTNSRPVAPLNEIGHVDIVDLTAGSSVDVSILAPIANVTRLDYDLTGTLGQTSYNLTTAGLVSDGASQVSFDLVNQGSTSTASSSLSLTFTGYDIDFGFSLDALDMFSYIVTLTDTQSRGVIKYTLDFDAQGLAASSSDVKFNGKTVAEWSGSFDQLALTPAEDSNLSAADVLTLDALFNELLLAGVGFNDLFLFALENTGLTLPGTGQ